MYEKARAYYTHSEEEMQALLNGNVGIYVALNRVNGRTVAAPYIYLSETENEASDTYVKSADEAFQNDLSVPYVKPFPIVGEDFFDEERFQLSRIQRQEGKGSNVVMVFGDYAEGTIDFVPTIGDDFFVTTEEKIELNIDGRNVKEAKFKYNYSRQLKENGTLVGEKEIQSGEFPMVCEMDEIQPISVIPDKSL